MKSSSPAEPLDFDVHRLIAFLHRQVPGMEGAIELQRIGGGQSNPTYFVTSSQRTLVLRKRPRGLLVPGAHDVAREFKVQQALLGTGVPVPEPVLYHPGEEVVGTDFYLMESVPARQYYDFSLPGVPSGERALIYADTARQLAKLHQVDWRALGLGEFSREGSYLRRQIKRWEQAYAGTPDGADAAAVASYLRANCPATELQCLIHGDFKFNNLLIHPTRPELAAILDWELFTIGDPVSDLAFTLVTTWDTRPEEYGGIMGLEQLDPTLPKAEDFLAVYYREFPAAPPLDNFYRTLALLRIGGICEGIRQRAQQGNAAAANAVETGKLGRVYLDRALALI